MARVQLPDDIDQVIAGGLMAVNGTARFLNTDTGLPVTIYTGRVNGTSTSTGVATVTSGRAVGWVESGPTLQYYVTPSGSPEQGPFYWEAKIGGSVGGYVPDGSGIPNITGPNVSADGTGGIYSDSGSGNIFHLHSYVANYGTRATVAVLGFGKGKHAFGLNAVGYSDGSDHVAIAAELDFGNLNATSGGQAYGLVLKSLGGNIGGQGGQAHIQMQAAASSPATDGIVFHLSAGQTPVTNALIRTNGAVACVNGIDLSSATFSGSALILPAGGDIGIQAGAGTKIGSSSSVIGFFGKTPAARPTLSYSRAGAGETTAGAAIRNALNTLGLIVDSTTA